MFIYTQLLMIQRLFYFVAHTNGDGLALGAQRESAQRAAMLERFQQNRHVHRDRHYRLHASGNTFGPLGDCLYDRRITIGDNRGGRCGGGIDNAVQLGHSALCL